MRTARIGSRCRPGMRSWRAKGNGWRSSRSWRSTGSRRSEPRATPDRREAESLLLADASGNPRAMNAAIDNIRNFAIIAHIDHGKSTLADRLIQATGGLAEREMVEQVLDSMDIERERGITIKAQTLANVYQAIDNNHEVVPVLNKVDLPAAEPEKVRQQIEDVIGLDASNAILISAKTGLNVPEVLEGIVTRLPPPKGDRDAVLKALLVDSWYDSYLGVVVLLRVVDGVLRRGRRIRMMGTGAAYEVDRVGVFTPKMVDIEELGPGEIGFLTASIKQVADTRVGDTITDDRKPV